VVGELAPKYGRKNLLIFGLVLMVAGTLLFSVAAFCKNDGGFYSISFIGRLIQGIADGMICVVIPSILSIEFPENNAKY
jgi:MFS family permease